MAAIAFGLQWINWMLELTRDSIRGFVLLIPGVFFVFPLFIRNVHNYWQGYMWLAMGVNAVIHKSSAVSKREVAR